MNTDLKFKILQYLNHKKPPSGFTFMQILTVVIILGLAAIAFNYWLTSTSCQFHECARQAEARTYVGTINKGLQAYYTEKNTFSSYVEDLGVGIKTASINWNYHVKVINSGTRAVAIGYSTTTPSGAWLKNYVGYVSLIPAGGNTTEVTSDAILCEQKTPGTLSLDIEWKPGIEPPRCNKDQQSVGGT
jgi:type IV pilus assembly protein PilA